MRELTLNEVEAVQGGISTSTQISSQMSMVGIGVATMLAGATAPVWFSAALIVTSVSLTYSWYDNQQG